MKLPSSLLETPEEDFVFDVGGSTNIYNPRVMKIFSVLKVKLNEKYNSVVIYLNPRADGKSGEDL